MKKSKAQLKFINNKSRNTNMNTLNVRMLIFKLFGDIPVFGIEFWAEHHPLVNK